MKTINNNCIKAMFLFLLGMALPFFCSSQQDSEYTQYMYNTVTVNPAYAGNRGVLSFNSLYRSQWTGLNGAPQSLTFSVNSPVGERGVGLGLSVIHDEVGPSTESNVTVDFSYTVPLTLKTNLSFGLKGGMNLLNVDFGKLDIRDRSELEFSQNIENRFSPNVGLGVYLHFDHRWYLGLSSPNILSTDHYDSAISSTASEKAHFYLIGGYVFDINSELKFKPAFLTKAVKGAPLAFDASANFLINDRFTVGLSYRLDAAISALVGFQINNRFMIGYSYDYDTTELGNYNSGSHDFFLRFEFTKRTINSINPRFF
ncbi:type IX secretion system membrane protein PorP/SprF [Ulvibacterium sp.]|uniref:PorP/SprF family type IX secretion system membrane protein n=1 Tax=Ulvibacterium sp. TaxID=2665914 RepID=UPI0026149595|nr:type IX secretion system membrane protein PorP/SprF [Ulvibacterium sp.]